MLKRSIEPQEGLLEPEETDRLLFVVAGFGLILFFGILALLIWAPHRIGVAATDPGDRCRAGPVCAVAAPAHTGWIHHAYALLTSRPTDHQHAS
jgi:hypothetical protein